NLPGTPSRTGPTNNLQWVNSCRCLHRDRWDEKIDHQFSSSEKIFGRYSHYHNRGQNGDPCAKPEFNASREINPTDDINGVISFTSIISRVMFNEFRIGYSIAPLNYTRQVGEDRILQDNFTLIVFFFKQKTAYEMVRTLYSDTG